MARAEIKISLFTAPEFGNAISICTVWPRDIYCFGLSFLYCGVSFIPSSRLWCYHLLITSSFLRHSGQLHSFRGSNMWTWGWMEMILHATIAFQDTGGRNAIISPHRRSFIKQLYKDLLEIVIFSWSWCLLIHR